MINIPDRLLQVYVDRFANRMDVYAKQFWTSTDYWYEPIWEPVTTALIRRHLEGEITLGWYCLNKENTWLLRVSDFLGASPLSESPSFPSKLSCAPACSAHLYERADTPTNK